jgi:predicted aconitase with swiveling domain
MRLLQGRGIIKGRAKGSALISRTPINFTASLTKLQNLLPGRRAEIQDRHHELYKQNVKGTVLVFPTCIGSTYTGMVLLEIMYRRVAPAAMIVLEADSLLVSGSAIAEVWFDCGIPIVEYPSEDLFEKIKTGDTVEVDGATGEIRIT